MQARPFAGAFLALALATTRASAQNADPFFYGDEAALGAGAVVASGRDSGAFWYNPAGFGGLRRGLVSASASTFGLRFRTIPGGLGMRVGGQELRTDISATDIISIPNAIVVAAKLSDTVALGGGLLITGRDVRSALASLTDQPGVATDGTPVVLTERLDLNTQSTKYHFGPSLGVALSPRLRVGASLYGTYGTGTNIVQYALLARSGATPPTDETAFITQSARVTSTVMGLAATVGVQWEASPKVTLGVAVRTPEIALSASNDGGAVVAVGSAGGTDPAVASAQVVAPPTISAAGKLLAPTRVLAGVAYALGPPQSWLELGVDAAHGLPDTPVLDAQQVQVNGRIGARYMLSPGWIVGGGVFSDRATVARVPAFVTSDRVDYYGATLGVAKRTPLALVKNPSPDALVLVTTLSLRTAVGFGEARSVTLDLDDPALPRDDRADVTFYEIMPYLGSSVVF